MTAKHAIAAALVALTLPAVAHASGPRECDINGTCDPYAPQEQASAPTTTSDNTTTQPSTPTARSSQPASKATSSSGTWSSRQVAARPPATLENERAANDAGVPVTQPVPPAAETTAAHYVAPPNLTAASESSPTANHRLLLFVALAGLVVALGLWLEYAKPSKFIV